MDSTDERTPLNGSARAPPEPTRRSPRARAWLLSGLVCGALAAALVLAICSASRSAPDQLTGSNDALALINGSDPWSCGSTPYDAGYIKLANKKDDHYFYWFVESSSADPSKDPLVLWLTGGAGSSSLFGLLTENGPCLVNRDFTTRANPYSWSQEANVIWLDQPTGTGFSYSNAPKADADRDEQNVGENIYWFLQGFIEKHPEFDGREFFITGESFAGHYIPAASHFIWLENQKEEAKNRKHINLQGIAIGNGLTDPAIQYQHYADMADNSYNVTLLTDEQVAQMRADSLECVALTKQCQGAPSNGSTCLDAVSCWSSKLIAPFSAAERNTFDLRQSCTDEYVVNSLAVCGLDFSLVEGYVKQPMVRAALHVDPAAKWTNTNADVANTFVASGDWSFSYSSYVADLLDGGVRVLIYAGDADLACNWVGNLAWTLAMQWRGRDGYNAAPERPFIALTGPRQRSGVHAGVARSLENLTFLRLFNSGHMVPTDQPEVSLDMINRFFRNEPL